MGSKHDHVVNATRKSEFEYVQPQLRRLGGLAAMTASGSGGNVESVQPNNCSQDLSRRNCHGG